MENIFVNGVHLVLGGIGGSAGDKNGIAKIHVPVNVPDLPTALLLSPGAVAAAIGLSGVICTDRPLSQDPDGEFTVTYQFEGFNQDWTFDQAKEFMQLSFKPNKNSDPIQTHPHFKDRIESIFGPMVDDKWPETYTPKAGTGVPGFSQGSGKALPNPMLGVDSWIKYGGTFSRSYACTSLPESVWENNGMLIDFPPDADKLSIPRFSNRKWLKEVPEIDEVGNAFKVTENYLLSGITNGSEAVIYAESQLSKGSK